MFDKTLLSRYGSEGECRITSLALKFACLEILKNTMTAGDITLLVDDVVGELDSSRQDNFYHELLNAGQIILAGTFLPICLQGKAKVFDVVGGKLTVRN
jgi:recombinational DNA repair ATPase RecF